MNFLPVNLKLYMKEKGFETSIKQLYICVLSSEKSRQETEAIRNAPFVQVLGAELMA